MIQHSLGFLHMLYKFHILIKLWRKRNSGCGPIKSAGCFQCIQGRSHGGPGGGGNFLQRIYFASPKQFYRIVVISEFLLRFNWHQNNN